MTDFIVYISAQQRMHAIMEESDAEDAKRPRRTSRLSRAGLDAARQQISLALHRLADAIQPLGEAAGAPLSASR
jgi:hypothetical protein